MEFKYTDSFGDTLKLKDLATRGTVAVQITSEAGAINTVVLPYDGVKALVEGLLEVSGEEGYIIPKTEDKVDAYRGWIYCGEGKDYIEASDTTAPEVLMKKAANLVTIAKEIRSRKELAAVEQSRTARRDKVTRELSGDPTARYEYATDLAQKAIDRIIATEEKKEEDKNA